jgi:ribonuclease-3
MLFGGRTNPHRELEKALGYTFRRKALLEAALTHRSYRFERPDVTNDNQRLEFLGDAVLCLLTAAYAYERFPDKDEGGLTNLRSQITSGKALAHCARAIHLGAHIRIGKGEEHSGGRHRHSNLADTLEAVIGAVYLDGGAKGCQKVFNKLFVPRIEALSGDVWASNPKGKLQEYAQRRWKASPRYRTVHQDGPAHAMVFTAEAIVGGRPVGTGRGTNKQEAEMQAAHTALTQLMAEER